MFFGDIRERLRMDTGTFKVRNWAKIADGGGVQFYADVMLWSPIQRWKTRLADLHVTAKNLP